MDHDDREALKGINSSVPTTGVARSVIVVNRTEPTGVPAGNMARAKLIPQTSVTA